MNAHPDALDQLVIAIHASPKYREISPDLARAIGVQELAKRRSLKEAIKSTKNRLHQVAGVYLSGNMNYAGWLDELARGVQPGDNESIRAICRRIMGSHASTRERLPILDHFYATTLAELGPIRRILDVACGLNPLALSWMPLAEGAEYYAYDIYSDMVAFLAGFFELERSLGSRHISGHAAVRDVIQSAPEQEADVALILKAIPCLEQIDRSVGARLLREVRADHILVSFPVHSLGGRGKGMLENYEARFHEMVAETHWTIRRFAFATELAFLVTK